MKASTEIVVQDGMKHRLGEDFYYKIHFSYGTEYEYHHPTGYYSMVQHKHEWWIRARKGCCWDGATKYPDYQWMLYPSLIHDILHWMIKRGVIEERYNFLIDRELEYMVRTSKTPIPWWQGGNKTRPIRAYIIRRATNTSDEKRSDAKDFKEIRIPI